MEKKSLKEKLHEEPFSFEFFQAVRLLERMFPERKAVGGASLPHEEVARFRSRVTLDFPSSEIHELREAISSRGDDTYLEVIVNFMGLVGPSGVLPAPYTELTLDRIRHRDNALWEFLDIFNHRAVSLFFRAWAKYRFPVAYERGNDVFTSYLFDISGLGTDKIRGRLGIDDESLLPYSGLISQKPHSSNAVENVVGDYFGVDAKVNQFFGQWLDLGPGDVTRLGKRNSHLGRSALVGSRVWDQQSKMRIRLEGLTFNQFQGFLPTGSAHQPLKSIIKFMAGVEFDYDVQLQLKAKQVPGLVLTTRAIRKPMLGWTSWLKTTPFRKDDEQVILSQNLN
ncbi:MAG: type VI secretion system baseplate subunit TssG [Blastocatellia bacterium]|nr:type VI secretion system baseplate subunit TssG [Blastocatellia bacterium]